MTQPELARPSLSIHPSAGAEIARYYATATATLEKHFATKQWQRDTDRQQAQRIAAALEGTFQSSDADCKYYACAMYGPDATDPDFFAALGIRHGDRCEVGGFDNPKLAVVDRRSTVQLLTTLPDDEFEELEEWISEAEAEAYRRAAAVLDEIGSPVSIRLCAEDGVSKLIFTVARSRAGTQVGVLTLRVES